MFNIEGIDSRARGLDLLISLQSSRDVHCIYKKPAPTTSDRNIVRFKKGEVFHFVGGRVQVQLLVFFLRLHFEGIGRWV